MRIKSVLALVLTFALLLTLAACGQAETPAGTTTSTTEAAEATTETVDDGKVDYTVKVVDESGNPVAQANVQICKDSCLPGVTNAEGVATFHVVEDAGYKVSFMVMPAGYESEETEFYFEDGSYEMTITLKAVA